VRGDLLAKPLLAQKFGVAKALLGDDTEEAFDLIELEAVVRM
jgi:hypothetical protein